jgi:hypothetical protein
MAWFATLGLHHSFNDMLARVTSITDMLTQELQWPYEFHASEGTP